MERSDTTGIRMPESSQPDRLHERMSVDRLIDTDVAAPTSTPFGVLFAAPTLPGVRPQSRPQPPATKVQAFSLKSGWWHELIGPSRHWLAALSQPVRLEIGGSPRVPTPSDGFPFEPSHATPAPGTLAEHANSPPCL